MSITPDGEEKRKYFKPPAIFNHDDDALGEIVARSQTIAITVYPSSFKEVARRIAFLMLSNKDQCIEKNILLCVNAPSPVKTFTAAMLEEQDSSDAQWLLSKVGIVQCLVHRTCVTPNKEQAAGDSACVLTNGYKSLIVDASALIRPLGETDVFQLCPDIAFAEHRKLFTYNMLHAIYSYNGFLRSYKTINECAADDEIDSMAHQAIEDITLPFCKEYGVSHEEMQQHYESMWKFAVHPVLNDEISRLAVDPIRKLGINDRIIGPLLLCYKHAVISHVLLKTVIAALNYNDPSDKAAGKLKQIIAQEGVGACIEQVCGIPKDHKLNIILQEMYTQQNLI